MKRFWKALSGLMLATALVACGGGGGSPGETAGGTDVSTGGGTTTPGTGTGTGTGTPSTATAAVKLTIVNAAGTEVTNIDSSGGFQARATVTNAAGQPQVSRLVTFSLPDAALATLAPTSALTNAQGVAQVSIAPASLNAQGAATVTSSASVDGAVVSGTRDFGISASNLSLSALSLGTTNLASGGNTSISVTALVNGAAASATPVNVAFATSCGRINGQTGSVSTTTNGSGQASATYTAVQQDGSLCSGPVSITASAAGASPQSSGLTVAAPSANAVTFVAATPQQIFVAGSGASEQSVVTFKVLSGTTPLANQTVTFSLTVNPGGVGLNASGSTAPVSATTDAGGNASVSVFSGTIPGPLRVRAALAADPTVFSESQNLTVASGPPSQRFMSMSVQAHNIEGADIDGTPTQLTVRLADRQGNPVEDGTVVNFTSEGGQVASSCATAKVNGISLCSVTFSSQNFRPANGRVSVLAFTNGTKDYVDVNGNNRFDAGTDTLVLIGDAYRDDDEDNLFDVGEFNIPRGGAVACATAGEPFPSRANTCDTQLATTVRQQAVVLFSDSTPVLKNVFASPGGVSFQLASAYQPLLPMPVGTTVSAVAQDNTVANNLSCAVTTVLGTPVVDVDPGTNPNADISTAAAVNLSGCGAGDSVIITVRAPSGLSTSFAVGL